MTEPITAAGRALLAVIDKSAWLDAGPGLTKAILAIETQARAAGREEAVERIRRLANILEGPTPGSIWLPDLLAILDAPAEEES